MAVAQLSDIDRFHKSYLIMPDGCWIWQKAISRAGYAVMRISDDPRPRAVNAHKWGFIKLGGDIPVGLVLSLMRDLCHNTACVNPSHWEPTTHTEMVRRGRAMDLKPICKHGHVMSEDNRTVRMNGRPGLCLSCKRADNHRRWEEDGDYLREYYRNYFRRRGY